MPATSDDTFAGEVSGFALKQDVAAVRADLGIKGILITAAGARGVDAYQRRCTCRPIEQEDVTQRAVAIVCSVPVVGNQVIGIALKDDE